jgi:Nine Cysteines Domain of family 3 GPCR
MQCLHPSPVLIAEIQFKLGHPQPPESVCSLECELGQAKKYVEGESCCWHCFNCTQYQVQMKKIKCKIMLVYFFAIFPLARSVYVDEFPPAWCN